MPRILLFVFLIIQNLAYSQKEFNLIKSSENTIVLDGIISEDEKRNSKIATLFSTFSKMFGEIPEFFHQNFDEKC